MYNIIIAFFEAIQPLTWHFDATGMLPVITKSVGLHLQRSLFFSLCSCLYGFHICARKISYVINFIVPEDEKVAVDLAASYWKYWFGNTWSFSWKRKRYVQAMGKYEIGLYVLILCFPINVILSYVLVWKPLVLAF